MPGSYLPESYTLKKDALLEPIRIASVLRNMGVPISANVDPSDLEIEIETVTDDPKIGISPEPFAGVRSTNQITKVRKKIPVISAPLSYKWDELVRINNSVLPFSKRQEILATHIARFEQAHAFALTTTGVRDSDAIPFIQGGTAVTTLTLASGDAAIAGLREEIGVLVTRYGSLKSRPLVLAFNNVAYAIAVKLVSSKTDKTFLAMAQEELVEKGGMGSGIVIIKELGNALTVSDDIMSIADSGDETMALMLMDVNHFEILSSRFDERSKAVNKLEGLNMNIIERWFPYVHDTLSIKYIINAPIT